MLEPRIAFQTHQVLIYGDNDSHEILHCQQIGTLSLPSGELLESDPLSDDNVADLVVAPGLYPIFVTTMLSRRSLNLAFTAIRFTQAEPVRWKLVHGRDELGQPLGYTVESGTGSLMDRTTKDLIYGLFDSQEFSDILFGISAKSDGWGEYHVPQYPEANLFYFLTDDGGYPSYVGYDASGTIVCMVTDFFGMENEAWSLWPPTLPAIPVGFDEQFFTWLGQMSAPMHDPGFWPRREPLAPDDLQLLERTQTIVLPEDLRLHYVQGGLWLIGDEPFQQWWSPLEKRVREALHTNKPLLPVLCGVDVVAVCDDENRYRITLPPVPGLYNNAFEYPDLKTYLMDFILPSVETSPA